MLQQIGDYRIVGKLGQGGMGAVFEAVHQQTQQRVAIKMLLPVLSQQPEVVGRFFNEARAVGMIGHPSIIEVFDVGKLPDGAAYMVMEFLDGETLGAHLKRRGPLGPAALPIVRDIAAALVQAHAKQIIHRDLKPENVMVMEAPGGGLRVKVLDFGIAKIAQDAELAAGMGVRTKTGTVLGTPTYMSPEQCLGSKVGAPTDVYALGAMMYQLIAGYPPFVGTGIGEVLAMHILDAPPPLSRWVPGIDPALEGLTLHMLDKKAENRPTMVAVSRAITQLIGGERPSAKTVIPATSTAATQLSLGAPLSPSRRGRWLALGVGGVVAAATVALVLSRTHTSSPIVPAATVPAATTQAPPAARSASVESILWLVKSEPTHADVVRFGDGVVLGRTPWYTEQPRGSGTVEVIVRRSGFADERVTLDRGANTSLHVRLTRRASTTKRAPAKHAAEEDELDVKPLK
jgi:eukaryotic-like serine/threonine-protein kinase